MDVPVFGNISRRPGTCAERNSRNFRSRFESDVIRLIVLYFLFCKYMMINCLANLLSTGTLNVSSCRTWTHSFTRYCVFAALPLGCGETQVKTQHTRWLFIHRFVKDDSNRLTESFFSILNRITIYQKARGSYSTFGQSATTYNGKTLENSSRKDSSTMTEHSAKTKISWHSQQVK